MGRKIFILFGILAGVAVPFAMLLGRAFLTHQVAVVDWVTMEMQRHSDIYIGVTVAAIIIFSLIGFLIATPGAMTHEEAQNLQDTNEGLQQIATTDGLTGLTNAGTIRDLLGIVIENSNQAPLTCLLMDIDHFKMINDRYGHPFGDDVLVRFAKILLNSTRRMDTVGRLGGEEFLIILPGTPQQSAMIVAERIRSRLEAESFLHEGTEIHITASLGVVSLPHPDLPDKTEALKAVDTALYAAKNSGRNRIVVWSKDLG